MPVMYVPREKHSHRYTQVDLRVSSAQTPRARWGPSGDFYSSSCSRRIPQGDVSVMDWVCLQREPQVDFSGVISSCGLLKQPPLKSDFPTESPIKGCGSCLCFTLSKWFANLFKRNMRRCFICWNNCWRGPAQRRVRYIKQKHGQKNTLVEKLINPDLNLPTWKPCAAWRNCFS